jgi:hypothetical protein
VPVRPVYSKGGFLHEHCFRPTSSHRGILLGTVLCTSVLAGGCCEREQRMSAVDAVAHSTTSSNSSSSQALQVLFRMLCEEVAADQLSPRQRSLQGQGNDSVSTSVFSSSNNLLSFTLYCVFYFELRCGWYIRFLRNNFPHVAVIESRYFQ